MSSLFRWGEDEAKARINAGAARGDTARVFTLVTAFAPPPREVS